MKWMKGNGRKAVLLILLLLLPLLPLHVTTAEDEATLTILHINDRHGTMHADPYLSKMAKDLVAKGENVLILDAGDTLHGQTTANLTKGEAMVELMNEVGYHAMVPGNHDFNFGVERLLELSERMNFPLLGANVLSPDGTNPFESYRIYPMNGIKVGVFGLATPETISKSDPRIVAGYTFEDPFDTARQTALELKEAGCDVIVALTHLGEDSASLEENKSEVLADIPDIDVVVDGHSHTVLENGKTIHNTLFAQTGYYSNYFGVVNVTLSSGAVSSKTARLIKIPGEGEETDMTMDEDVVNKIAGMNEALTSITSQIVGHTPVRLNADWPNIRYEETNLADLVTDSMRYATNADVAFLGGGNIRASIEAGDITMGQVLTVLPFSNLLATIELTGADLLEVLENGVSLYPEAAGRYIHVSGLRFTFHPNGEPMHRVTDVTMANGDPLHGEQTYTVATIDYIMAGGDGYGMMGRGTNKIYYQGDVEAFVEYLATNPTISAEPDNRVMAVTPPDDGQPSETPNPPAATVTPPPPTVTPPTTVTPAPTVMPAPDNGNTYANLPAPSIKVKSSGYSSLKVSWKKLNHAVKYTVYRSTGKKGRFQKIKTVTTTHYVDTKLVTGNTYYYKVRAVYKEGGQTITGKDSNLVKAKPSLAAVKGLTIRKPTTSKRTIAWKKTPGASGYEVYQATGKSAKYKKIGDTRRIRFTEKGSFSNRTRFYKVRAYRLVRGKKSFGPFSHMVR